MKSGMMKRSMLVLAAMTLMITGGAACGPAPMEQEAAVEAVSPDDVHASRCGDFGYFTCPDTGRSYYYEACAGYELKQDTIEKRCNLACASPCVDSGWNNYPF